MYTSYIPFAVLAVLSGVMMALERGGMSTTLTLSFKSDLKRETRFLAQYGQFICTILTSLLVWQLDPERGVKICEALWTAWLSAIFVSTTIKRTLGRVRPRGERAGQFLGPSFQHANYRESFPSNHSASAAAYAGILAMAYPHAAVTFWMLAIVCAILRYLMDAHWPSDVLAGVALGYLSAMIVWRAFF